LNGDQAIKIARLLRVLNAAFNASLTIQRLEAVQTLIRQFQSGFVPIQQELVELAIAELDDALAVMQDASVTPIQPDVQADFIAAKGEAQLALAATTDSARNQRVANALTRMKAGRGRLGTNINFLMGQSNQMF
jgi:hypothetical protein